MGHLSLDTGGVTATKLTCSFWFRVPSATLSARKADWQMQEDAYEADESGTVHPPAGNSGLVPLMTFGKRLIEVHDSIGMDPTTHQVEIGSGSQIDYLWDCVSCSYLSSGPSGPFPIFQTFSNDLRFSGQYCDNSLFGINIIGDTPVFDFRFQYDWGNDPTVAGYIENMTSWSRDPDPAPGYHIAGQCSTPNTCMPPDFFTIGDLYFAGDTVHIITSQGFESIPYSSWARTPERFLGFSGDPVGKGISVAPNRWHHVIFSLDLSGGDVSVLGTQTDADHLSDPGVFEGAIVSAVKAYLSFDDVNRTASSISECCGPITDFRGSTAESGPNDLLTELAAFVVQAYQLNNGTSDLSPITGSGSRTAITQTGHSRPSYDFVVPAFNLETITIPGDSDTTQLVQMAHLQVFTGVAVDTSDIANRRLFVTSDGKPADMALASAALGRPLIAIKGAVNWKNGISSGSAGDLTPVGTINNFAGTVGL